MRNQKFRFLKKEIKNIRRISGIRHRPNMTVFVSGFQKMIDIFLFAAPS